MRPERTYPRGTRGRFGLLVTAVALALVCMAVPAQAAPVTGAIWTTNSACSAVNQNQFNSKDDVYLNGGPTNLNNPNGSGLPDGNYFVQVTEPDGTPLGHTTTASFVVAGGAATQCYQLSAILVKQSDSTPGYDTTTNPGGEYKVWVSKDSTFPPSDSKTDNFKVEDELVPPQEDESHLQVQKFYDANTNGVKDGTEPFIAGWKVHIQDGISFDKFTPVDLIVAPDTYTVSEFAAVEPNWLPTTATSFVQPVALSETKTVTFGNVCTGPGGGLTLGFWSNKNGAKALATGTPTVLSQVLALNLRKGNGGLLGTPTLGNFQKFLLEANATNMANMLSAQLAAMQANVASGGVSGSALIYAPQVIGANGAGFVTVQNVMDQANASLLLNGLTLSGHPERANQEVLKTALDRANNNLNFAQQSPCAFSFAP